MTTQLRNFCVVNTPGCGGMECQECWKIYFGVVLYPALKLVESDILRDPARTRKFVDGMTAAWNQMLAEKNRFAEQARAHAAALQAQAAAAQAQVVQSPSRVAPPVPPQDPPPATTAPSSPEAQVQIARKPPPEERARPPHEAVVQPPEVSVVEAEVSPSQASPLQIRRARRKKVRVERLAQNGVVKEDVPEKKSTKDDPKEEG